MKLINSIKIYKAKDISQLADVEICVFISFKNKVESFFSEGSVFERSLKPRIQNILGEKYSISGGIENALMKESIGVQCNVSIDKNIKLSTQRENFE